MMTGLPTKTSFYPFLRVDLVAGAVDEKFLHKTIDRVLVVLFDGQTQEAKETSGKEAL